MVIAFLVVLVVQLLVTGSARSVAATSDTPILILLLQLEVLWGFSCGVGNLGVVSRSGCRTYRCIGNSVPHTARNATTPPATSVALGASATCRSSTTMVAARLASTVATMVGVFTKKCSHSR